VKPDVDLTLQRLAESLLVDVAPSIGSDYAKSNTLLSAMMLQSAAEEWDRAAARRVEENRALRALFAKAAGCVEDAALAEQLRAAAQGEDASLRIAALEESNAALRALLIELHARVEALEGPEARRIESAIWDELRASTERRALSSAPF